MIRHLKRGKSAAEIAAFDDSVSTTVEKILKDIEARGDVAIRELSQRFDAWNPAQFQLEDNEIQNIIDRVPEQDLRDIRFAQEQVRCDQMLAQLREKLEELILAIPREVAQEQARSNQELAHLREMLEDSILAIPREDRRWAPVNSSAC